MRNSITHTLYNLIPFILIGFCISWIFDCVDYEHILNYTAANMNTNNALSFVTETKPSNINWDLIIDDNCIVYSYAPGNYSIRGVLSGMDASFPIPMLSGRYFSQQDFKNNKNVAIIGKGLIDETAKMDGKEYLELNGEKYEIIGIVGLNSLPSAIDYSIYVTLGNSIELLGDELNYTFDGSNEGVKNSVEKFISMYKADELPNQFVNLDIIYTNKASNFVYLLFLIILLFILTLLTFFTVFNKKEVINVYSINGAKPYQIVYMALKKYVLLNYFGMLFGIIIATSALYLINKTPLSILPLIFAATICFVVLCILSAIYILRILNNQQFHVNLYKKATTSAKLLKTCFLISVVGILVLSNIVIISFPNKINEYNSYKNKAEKNYYTITSPITSEEFNKAYNNPTFLNRMKNVYKAFKSNKEYNFYEISNQYVLIKNKNFPYAFYYGDSAEKLSNAVQVGNIFFNVFQLNVESGRLFEADDYLGNGKKEIPVILGNAYKNFYSVGDKIIGVEYLFKNYTFNIVGILEKDSYYITQGNTELLDYKIIMPSLIYTNFPEYDTNDYMSQFALYTQKLDGVFVLNNKEDFANLSVWVSELVRENGIYELRFLTVPKSSAYFLQCISQQFIKTSFIMLNLLLATMVLLIIQISGYLLELKKGLYKILLVCGANLQQIVFKLYGELILLVVLSNIIAFVITISFISISYSVIMPILTILTVLLITSVYLRRTLYNNSF